jgi:hypothetical protein
VFVGVEGGPPLHTDCAFSWVTPTPQTSHCTTPEARAGIHMQIITSVVGVSGFGEQGTWVPVGEPSAQNQTHVSAGTLDWAEDKKAELSKKMMILTIKYMVLRRLRFQSYREDPMSELPLYQEAVEHQASRRAHIKLFK